MSALDHLQLRLVQTPDDANDLLRWLGERRPVLAIDTETTGLKWWTPGFLRMVQYGDGRMGWSVPQAWYGRVNEMAMRAVAEDRRPTVFHNAKFDLHALRTAGLPLPELRRIHDTKLMHHVWRNEFNHSLKPIAVDLIGPEAGIGQNALKREFAKHGWNMSTGWARIAVDNPVYWQYAALDTSLTAVVAERLWPQLDTEMSNAYERALAYELLTYRIEHRGMRVDPMYVRGLRRDWVTEAAELRTELETYGLQNPSSGKQLASLLDDEGWIPEEWTETGLPKLDRVVMAELAERTGITGEVAVRVIRYKRLVKWVRAYLDTFMDDRDETDHIHPSINVFGARTGRDTVNAPPLQQLPRGPLVRNSILPEEGAKVWGIDYDAQELRFFASYAREAGLVAAFREGRDLHSYAASMAYGIPLEEVPKELRQVAKNVQYSRIYGAGPAKMAKTAGVPQAEIERFIAGYDRAFPDVDQFMRQVEMSAAARYMEDGRAFVRTGYDGRKLAVEQGKEYALVNYLIQGTAADLLHRKMLHLEAAGFEPYIMLPVHDEVLFSFPEEGGEEMAREAHAILEELDEWAVPLVCGIAGPGDSWGAIK